MDRYAERVSRPTLSSPERKDEETPVREPLSTRAPQPGRTPENKDKKLTKKALFGLVGIVLVLALFWWFFLRNIGIPSYVETSKYQVVCLQSGECYFGKITSVSSDTVQLKNVFYVQKTAGTSATSTTSTTDNNLQLIKLGNEVHGPDDMMAINRTQVLYIENLKSDGKVTQTINTYYQQNK
jgi:hypothetical protein